LLNVTNGDAAIEALVAGGVSSEILAWRDVLHEGPVPAGLDLEELSDVRARFIAAEGWGALHAVQQQFAERDARLRAERGDVVLWFEHDLYDQLQLIQVLDCLAEQPPRSVSLVCQAEYLGPATPERIAAMRPVPVGPEQIDLARRAWDAVRADSPQGVVDVVAGDCDALPFLRSALVRLLEELPGVDGLSRTERSALVALRAGCATREAAFLAVREEPLFLGDATFYSILDRLRRGPEPLLDGLAVTAAGRDVLDGRRDWATMGALDRWVGGVHLVGPHPCRWDHARRRLVASA
jgi:hypothetical protein